jgi:hypothetical protein
LRHHEFLQKKIWDEPTRDLVTLDKVQFKLKKVKKFLKWWGFNLAGAQKKRMKEIQEEQMDLELLEETVGLVDDQCRKKMEMNAELHQILENEELYWYKRSHETWMLKGDNNTEFFHRVSHGRRRKQSIFSLKDGENVVIGDENLLALCCWPKPTDGCQQ